MAVDDEHGDLTEDEGPKSRASTGGVRLFQLASPR
jgi:hypothetical protein